MQCPFCLHDDTKVVDSRHSNDFEVRRRRECPDCSSRFTTYETTDAADITVVKRDGSREPFSADKMRKGIARACKKRGISKDDVDTAVKEIAARCRFEAEDGEIESSRIGDLVIEKLGEMDEVAYLRFASIYKDFDTVDDFQKEAAEVSDT